MYSEWRDTFSVHGKVEAAVGNVLVETQQATSVVHTNCNCSLQKNKRTLFNEANECPLGVDFYISVSYDF